MGDDDDAQVDALIDEVLSRSGHDFRNYSAGSRLRRIETLLHTERLPSVAALRARLAEEPALLHRLLQALSVPATAMFRDPQVFRALRTRVVPLLATYPTVRIWLAGCATGEEAWSMAIMLHEEGLYERCRIYATDINPVALERARSGIFPLSSMRDYTRNHLDSGGGELSRWYTAAYGFAKFDATLSRNLVFAVHNLAVDKSFNEFQLILCRNVMIYFDDLLRDRVHHLLHASLAHLGVLCLGAQERLPDGPDAPRYTDLDAENRLYRKRDTPPAAPV